MGGFSNFKSHRVIHTKKRAGRSKKKKNINNHYVRTIKYISETTVWVDPMIQRVGHNVDHTCVLTQDWSLHLLHHTLRDFRRNTLLRCSVDRVKLLSWTNGKGERGRSIDLVSIYRPLSHHQSLVLQYNYSFGTWSYRLFYFFKPNDYCYLNSKN